MKKNFCLAVSLFIYFLAQAQAQTWRSSLYSYDWQAPLQANFYSDKLIQDFSFAGYHRGEKPIPATSATILDVTKAPYQADPGGTRDVTALLQQALDDAGQIKGGAVVYLPPGTYQVSPVPGQNYCLRINSSRVVLRGAGQQQTFLFNASADMRKKAIISITSGTSWAEGENKTRGSKPQVRTTAWQAGTEAITDPVDFVEGIGQGHLLEPQSLYSDQKNRRLARVSPGK